MGGNPFDDEDAEFLVVVNAERHHALWPVFVPVPGGWTRVHGPTTRAACVGYVDEHWTDLRTAGSGATTDGRRHQPERR